MDPDPDRLVRVVDPGIRIRNPTKMSRIPNTDFPDLPLPLTSRISSMFTAKCQNSEITFLTTFLQPTKLPNSQWQYRKSNNLLQTIVQGKARVFHFVVLALVYKYNTICSCTC